MTYFAVIAVVLILMNTFFLVEARNIIFISKQALVQSQAAIIVSYLENADILTVEHVSSVMAAVDVTGVAYAIITDAGGEVLYPAARAGISPETTGHLDTAKNGNIVFHSRFADGVFSSSAFAPVVSGGAVIGAVYVHNEDPEQGTILLNMQNTLQNISVGVAVFSVAAVAIIIWSVMRRISSVLNAIKIVREGEYNYRITLSGHDELALLGDEFNSLTDRLRETDEIRRRFAANASHELKTPLASIRLLSDSILQNIDIERETVREFVGDIGDEAERLARTTEKLMTLTRLDSAVPTEYTDVYMHKAVADTLRSLRPLAMSRGLALESSLQENLLVFATEDSIHQVVFNLVENAIKYNKPDGSVSVRLHGEGESVVLTVDDTGVGVSMKDLPYIFDRFYRVDKARSREAGGSGLGLSIVMDTVRELGGRVDAEPRAEGGMRFQVRFTRHAPEQ